MIRSVALAGGAAVSVALVLNTLILKGPEAVGGTAAAAQPAGAGLQARELKAAHRAGQTFLTWTEPEPVTSSDAMSVPEVLAERAANDKSRRIRYRIYRSTKPIASVAGMAPIAEVPPLTCWNTDFYGLYPQPHHQATRYSIEEGQPPLIPGTGLYVHNPDRPGNAFYAVTLSVNGVENPSLDGSNVVSIAVSETVGQGEPVFQREERPELFNYVSGPTLRYYVRWESPPNFSVENKPFDYLVAVPRNVARPAPVMIGLHAWGGNLAGYYGWWFNAEKGAMLVSSNATPYDWWTGYHERLFSPSPPKAPDDWRQGVVRPYAQTRLFSFLDWAASRYDIDLTRTFTAGASMGGSGATMMALRHPDRIAWSMSWVGIHRPQGSPTFKESYELVYGKPEWGARIEDGTPAWDYFDNVAYLRRYPERHAPLLIFANGKNDASIGWRQAVEFVHTLQETRQPHIFFWGQAGHGERAALPGGDQRIMSIDVRTNQTLPAFSRGSLDGNPGNGSPDDGEPQGQINAHLYWDVQDIIDRPDAWEVTVGVFENAPRPTGTVDVTPRRVQRFTLRPGERVSWTNTSVRGPRVAQSGSATADELGLVTLEQLTVTSGKTRIRITKSDAAR